MRRTQSRSSGFFLAASLGLAALIFISSLPLASGPRGYLKGPLAPLAYVTGVVVDRAGGALSVFADAGRLREQNDHLTAENAALRRQVAELQATAKDDTELRAALDFRQRFGHRLLAAAVIGRSPDALTDAIILDKGRAEGVRRGMVVVAGGGLVGHVVELSDHTAAVQALTDIQSRVNAYLTRPGLNGTVAGLGGALSMEVIPAPGATGEPGDWAVTSGIGGTYPRGIPVGQVTSFHRRDSALTQSADLAPAVDLRRISVAMVVVDFLPAA